MQNNIQEDLKIFNELIEKFLKEEINNPISDVILTADIRSIAYDLFNLLSSMPVQDYKLDIKNLTDEKKYYI